MAVARRRREFFAAWSIGLAAALAPPSVAAQSLGLNPAQDRPRWLTAWSPLDWDPDLTRRLPSANLLIPGYRTRIGEFWTAGNPAALAREVDTSHTEFALAGSRQRGDYRRPLDPGGTELMQLRGESWRSLQPGFSLIGRVVADREELDPGTASDETEPYSSSPFVTLDTSQAAVRRTRVRLDGAGGWQLGSWGLGLGLGLENRDHQTNESGLTRRVRGTTAGVVLGASRRLGSFDLGVYGRYRNRNETIRLTEVTAQGKVYQLEGLRDVALIDFLEAYYRRIDEVSTAAGASTSGPLGGGVLAGYGEVRRLTERMSVQEQNNPLEDSWRVTGWAAGLAWRRPLNRRWSLEASLSGAGLTGKADAAFDSTGVFYTSHERRAAGQIELHFDSHAWELAAGVGFEHEVSDDADTAPDVSARVSSTSPSLQLLAGRQWGAVRIILSAAALFYAPSSRIPDPNARGQAFRRFIAPGLDLYGLAARPSAVAARLEWRVSAGSTLWISGRTESLSPRAAPLTPFSPNGSRRATALEMGVTLGR